VTAAALLTRLAGLGVSAEADHGAPRLRPASLIPADLLAKVRENKAGLLALLAAPANDLETLPPAPLAITDLGELPAGPCPNCGPGVWWRMSVLSGGPGPWHCKRCVPPCPADWIDGSAVPADAPSATVPAHAVWIVRT
jgi:hypothetical protein